MISKQRIYQGVAPRVGDVVWIQARVVRRDPNSTVAILEVSGRAMLTREDGSFTTHQVDPVRFAYFCEDIWWHSPVRASMDPWGTGPRGGDDGSNQRA
jgi:hypothetical protein